MSRTTFDRQAICDFGSDSPDLPDCKLALGVLPGIALNNCPNCGVVIDLGQSKKENVKHVCPRCKLESPTLSNV
jgi:predicted RNA-binding Zn-ribbon protein involved in translation (DUF1610 family)